ncbi:flavin reductase [Paraburkholderia rhynchosiae]|uniref:FMN reductase (NADH) RutF n=1 Tax=Paraburkholderia rhynchosiae TaxID=487049 RepID=A0A2N7W7V4_9BURK|nr:flavin reductase [Paraburkholderia rhynchosiae]PMS25487.1 flavin reductase [Paraburkholderia rhynchosiae]CAB3733968.1 FMN reductase (NADH) RutF [Paraburkholderia rhynchosiae]
MSELQAPIGDIVAEFKRAMRRLAATVTIISTADKSGARHGMTATAVNSVSTDPPSLLVCINHSASIHSPLTSGKHFCVNVLTTEHEDLVSAFSGRLTGSDRFKVGRWYNDAVTDSPYLENAQCNLFCEVDSIVSAGTHSIVIGKVVAVRVAEGIAPLIYTDGKLSASQPLQTGNVRLDANISAITQFLPDDLRAFNLKNPLIDIHLEEKISTSVVDSVASGVADVGIMIDGKVSTQQAAVDVFPYRQDELVLAVPYEHALAERSSVRFVETLEYDYVDMHPGSQISHQLSRAAVEAGMRLRCRTQVKSYDALCMMVQAGHGIGILPRRVAQSMARALKIKIVAIDEPWASRTLAICVRSYEGLSLPAKRLVDHLRQQYEAHATLDGV